MINLVDFNRREVLMEQFRDVLAHGGSFGFNHVSQLHGVGDRKARTDEMTLAFGGSLSSSTSWKCHNSDSCVNCYSFLGGH